MRSTCPSPPSAANEMPQFDVGDQGFRPAYAPRPEPATEP